MLQQSIGNCATGKLDFTIEFEIYVLATGKMQKEIISNRQGPHKLQKSRVAGVAKYPQK